MYYKSSDFPEPTINRLGKMHRCRKTANRTGLFIYGLTSLKGNIRMVCHIQKYLHL